MMKKMRIRLFIAKILHPRSEVFQGWCGLGEDQQTFVCIRPK